jgi:hypothetical protein
MRPSRKLDLDTPELRAEYESMLAYIDEIASQQLQQHAAMQAHPETPAEGPECLSAPANHIVDVNEMVPEPPVEPEVEKLVSEIGEGW